MENNNTTENIDENKSDEVIEYKEVYHITIDSNSMTDSTMIRVKDLTKSNDTIAYYYTDTAKPIDKNMLNSRLHLLRRHFGKVVYAGNSTYTNSKTTGLHIDYLKVVFSHRDSKHILVNMKSDLCYYSKLIAKLFGIKVVNFIENNKNIDLLDVVYDMVVINNILKLSNKYKKVVFIDTDNVLISLSGTLNKLIGGTDTLYLSIGLRGVLNNSSLTNNVDFRLKLSKDLRDEIEDRLVSLDLNVGTVGNINKCNKSITVINELVDTVIMLLSIYMHEKGKKITVFTGDSGYIALNKITNSRIISDNYVYINKSSIDSGLFNVEYTKKLDKSIINSVLSIDRKLFIKDFNVWGLDGKTIYDDLVTVKSKIDSLGLNIL